MSFTTDGYLVVPDALNPAEICALREEAARICAEHVESLPNGGVADPLCIHFPHKLSALMRAMLAHPMLVSVLTQLIGPNVKCMQSMLFLKRAGDPGQAWHQDEAFIPTRDRSLAAAWMALDDATVENGCLWVLPGSHRNGIIWPQRAQGDAEFDAVPGSYGFSDEDAAIPVEVASGSVVLFHGYLLHKSHRNRAATGYRRALVNHYMSAESLLPWGVAGREDNRDIVLVAGTDPYAWKGIEDRNTPYVRRKR